MQAVLDIIRTYPGPAAVAVLVVGLAVWHAWDFHFRPLTTPKHVINSVVDDLIANHGPRSEEVAYAEEESAWHASNTVEQGKWRRVRRELWRRYRAGERE